MLRYVSFLILMVILKSCHFKEENYTIFSGYFDDSLTKLKMKGPISNGLEYGNWEFYDENGILVQQGNFRNGNQIGQWMYNYKMFDSLIYWNIYSNIQGKFSFSLPNNFKESTLDNDTSIFSARDSISGNTFSVMDYGTVNKGEIGNYFKKNSEALVANNYEILNSFSLLVTSDSMQFYLDKFDLRYKEGNLEFVMYNIYTLFNEKMLIFGYNCPPKDSLKGKFLLEEIFYHATYEGKKVANNCSIVDRTRTYPRSL